MTEKKTDTWMPLYIGDYLADTMSFTTEEHGAYVLLLMACWREQGKPLSGRDKDLATITGLSLARWRAGVHARRSCWRSSRCSMTAA